MASRSLTSLSSTNTAHKAPDTQSGRRHGPRAELRRCFVKIFLVVQIFSANHTLLSRGSELLPESRRSLERLPRCWRGGTSAPLTLTYCNTHKERDEEGFYRGQSLCLYNGLNLEQSTQPGAPPDTTRERLVDTWTGGSWVARQPSSIPLCHISSSLASAVSPRASSEPSRRFKRSFTITEKAPILEPLQY